MRFGPGNNFRSQIIRGWAEGNQTLPLAGGFSLLFRGEELRRLDLVSGIDYSKHAADFGPSWNIIRRPVGDDHATFDDVPAEWPTQRPGRSPSVVALEVVVDFAKRGHAVRRGDERAEARKPEHCKR